tara:strand:- start:181 stop:528 length:348 start_codon:yes stop_codon:yes gene_type:complete
MTTKNDVTGDEIKSRVQTSSEYQDNWDNIFVGKRGVPLGEDTRPKDRIKQGISSSTIIEEWDCTKPKELISFVIMVRGTVQRTVTVQAGNLEEADVLAIEEFCSLTGADEASVVW